jgi:tetratricopeptide (TPR) repeat protein
MNKLFALVLLISALVFQSCEPREERAKKLIKEGITLSYLAQYDEALQCFEKAKKLQPALAEPYYQIANVNVTQREFSKALENLNKAIELDSLYGLAYANRAKVVFVISGDRNMACPDWIKAHELGVPSLFDEIKHCPGGMEVLKHW